MDDVGPEPVEHAAEPPLDVDVDVDEALRGTAEVFADDADPRRGKVPRLVAHAMAVSRRPQATGEDPHVVTELGEDQRLLVGHDFRSTDRVRRKEMARDEDAQSPAAYSAARRSSRTAARSSSSSWRVCRCCSDSVARCSHSRLATRAFIVL